MIQINEIYKSFKDLEVLKGISFDVHEGEIVTVIGPSGSGKSTLLRCINHLEEPQSEASASTARNFGTAAWTKRRSGACGKRAPWFSRITISFSTEPFWKTLLIPLFMCRAWINRKPSKQPWRCWKRSAFQKKRRLIPVSFPAASSSGWESPGYGGKAEGYPF